MLSLKCTVSEETVDIRNPEFALLEKVKNFHCQQFKTVTIQGLTRECRLKSG